MTIRHLLFICCTACILVLCFHVNYSDCKKLKSLQDDRNYAKTEPKSHDTNRGGPKKSSQQSKTPSKRKGAKGSRGGSGGKTSSSNRRYHEEEDCMVIREGPMGPPGEPGVQGIRGMQGVQGVAGVQGVSGIPGTAGRDGNKGQKGNRGYKGQKGEAGEPVTPVEASKIAFSVTLDKDMPKEDGYRKIFYDRILSNRGDGYDPKSGIFTVPLNGTYVIGFGGVSYHGQSVLLHLVRNGQRLLSAYDNSGCACCEEAVAKSADKCAGSASNTGILDLEEGDLLWIELPDKHGIHNALYHNYASFYGYLLFADDD